MLMTDETKTRLLFNVEARLTELTSEIDKLNTLYNKLESYQEFLTERNIENNFGNLKGLLNFRIIVGIINLDLCSAVLIYLRGKFQYEAINSARQIIVVINEGYKKLYNFVIEKETGDKIWTYRNNSFWIKEIGQIITNDLREYKSQYDLLTTKFDNYLSVNFETLKIQRDLSIHYDKEPIKVYKMLTSLDIEETFKKLIPFLDIMNELFLFTSTLSNGLLQKTELIKQEHHRKIDDIAELLDKHKTERNEEQIKEFKEQILGLKNLFRT